MKAITVLSHAGICLSYTTSWKYLLQLTEEARYAEQVRRHERQGKCTCMITNVTQIVELDNYQK